MTSGARRATAALALLVVAAMTVSAQQAQNPMLGVWLLSPTPLPLATLLAFREDTYEVVGRISYHGTQISYEKRDEDRGPHKYTVQELTVQEGHLTFRLVLDGTSYKALAPRSSLTKTPQTLELIVDGALVATLTPVPELRPADTGVSAAVGLSPSGGRAPAGSVGGWNVTDKGSFRIERFWEEVGGAQALTYAVVSYKNTTERTFTSAVVLRATVYDGDDRFVNGNMRSLLASELGPIAPGFTGEVKIPIEADKGVAKSVRVSIERAN